MANSIHVDAPKQLPIEKGIITKKKFLTKLKQAQFEHQKKQNDSKNHIMRRSVSRSVSNLDGLLPKSPFTSPRLMSKNVLMTAQKDLGNSPLINRRISYCSLFLSYPTEIIKISILKILEINHCLKSIGLPLLYRLIPYRRSRR
jgi:hypothetical protein